MNRCQQKPQRVLQAPETNVEETLDIQQCEIELLREQIKSLNLELRDKNQELQEVEQELRYTNGELGIALWSDCLTYNAAKQSAKEILVENLPTREALAALLNAVYGIAIKPWELGRRAIEPQLRSLLRAKLDRPSAKHLELNAQFQALRARFLALQARTAKYKT